MQFVVTFKMLLNCEKIRKAAAIDLLAFKMIFSLFSFLTEKYFFGLCLSSRKILRNIYEIFSNFLKYVIYFVCKQFAKIFFIILYKYFRNIHAAYFLRALECGVRNLNDIYLRNEHIKFYFFLIIEGYNLISKVCKYFDTYT